MSISYSEKNLFADLIGQPLAVSILEAAIAKSYVAPAYLFAGPEGVGRKLAALRFLEGVLNSGKHEERTRRRLEGLNHPDLLWIEPTYTHQGRLVNSSAAAEEGINRRSPPQIRLEQIRSVKKFLSRQPVESKRGMVVIEDVEAMPEASSNALLKTLEEPGHGLLILLSSAPDRLLSTICSRCQKVIFNRLDNNSLSQVFDRIGDKQTTVRLNQADQQELLALSGGSPGALVRHINIWESLPKDLLNRLKGFPHTPKESLSLAKDLTETLDGEEQIWLIDWLGQHLWLKRYDAKPVKRLAKLRKHLLNFVQPRLAWEVALLQINIDL